MYTYNEDQQELEVEVESFFDNQWESATPVLESTEEIGSDDFGMDFEFEIDDSGFVFFNDN